jgi:serine/alanine adding enzyme
VNGRSVMTGNRVRSLCSRVSALSCNVTYCITLPIHQVKIADDSIRESWNGYVCNHPAASLFHLFGWREVIHGTYGHDTYYLMAVREESGTAEMPGLSSSRIVGILPLIHFKHFMFGSQLVSLPFLDGGGILAEGQEVEKALLSEAVSLGRRIGANRIDLRCERAVACCDEMDSRDGEGASPPAKVAKRSTKVRMLLSLPGSSDLLAKSFKSKLRSQINKPLKEGCTSSTGGLELLEDFYKVFAINMRDLGSPVHSIELMRRVLGEFPEHARIIVVYKSDRPVASALVIGFNGMLRNPWASSDRRFASMSPNMLLYLRILEFGCDNGYQVFDFGRSTQGEGTYKFKEQWGAVPAPLHWYLISLDGKAPEPEKSGAEMFETAMYCWKKLPLAVTKIVGPRVRKHITL